MHEIMIVKDIFKTLEVTYGSKIESIIKVQVEAGLLCNVQPILIQNAFEVLILEQAQFANIDLEIILLPVIAYCEKCKLPFHVRLSKFVCACGTPARKIIQGEELRISKVEYSTIKYENL